MNVLSVLSDAKRKTIRVTFCLDKDHFLVVKLFNVGVESERESLWTVKLWHGNYERTKSFWNTQAAVTGEARLHAIKLAESNIQLAKSQLDTIPKI
jgi:hypothetical protein